MIRNVLDQPEHAVAIALVALALTVPGASIAVASDLPAAVDAIYRDLDALYIDLHRSPELSLHETQTAAKLAERLRRLGYDVTAGVGGTGIVGVLRNGEGPTVMLRTDLDGLPVTEKTGLPYASTVTTTDDAGATVGVMHACGHDVHMTSWIGAATLLSRMQDRWSGTLVMVGQPAEERGLGAAAMLEDGLFERFPRPDYAVAMHTSAALPAGVLGYSPGNAMASVDSVDIEIHGAGGHGAYPHTTIDPIVIAARTIVSLQTIVAREINPLDPAVVTVGSIHAGSKHNIIPDSARLQLTVRSYDPQVREHLLRSIERIAKAEAAAAGAAVEPEVRVSEGTPATWNDPDLTARLVEKAFLPLLGEERVLEQDPVMAGEDFSRYGLAGVPAMLFWIGAVERERWEAARQGGDPLPSLHSPLFAPDREPTLRAAVLAQTGAALELLGRR
jgi:hippurate hydrolase